MTTSTVHYSASSRIGKFNVPFEILFDGSERPMLQALFGLCVILDTYRHESGRGMTYIAASELFQPLRDGEEIPDYRIEFVCGGPFENQEYEARRINSGPFGFYAIRQIVVRVPPAKHSIKMNQLH